MWRSLGLLCAVTFLTLLPPTRAGFMARGANGGTNCAACAVLVGLVEQLAQVYNEDAVKALDRFCSFLPDQLQAPCRAGAKIFAPYIAEAIYNKETPDVVCHAIGFCKVDPGHQACHLFPVPKGGMEAALRRTQPMYQEVKKMRQQHGYADICNIPGIKEICDIINRAFNSHLPAEDLDKDGFSTIKTFRGSSWRGKDCNDLDSRHHPGARPINGDVLTDSNCNGISGLDSETGLPYEDLLCNGTEPRGMILLGDSIGAHFHLPPQWFEAKSLNPSVFKDLLFILENEIDWPELSAATGHMNNTFGEVIKGPVDSIYMRLRERNRCNHRDYQNIGVNGGRSGSMNSTIVRSLVRNRMSDYPALVNIEVVGNDVCNGHPDTLSHMTKPDEFRKNMLDTLQYLDGVLPAGSHVWLTGLANGSLLYDNVHDRIYPLGSLRNDITYTDFYSYMNCLEISPCAGWLTDNSTLRYLTTKRAFELSDVLKNITATSEYKNFDLVYLDIGIDEVIAEWEANGGEGWQLIEPVDGFHINQQANALAAAHFWKQLEKEYPDLMGKVNPNNDRIKELFGDQGGY
ncbi:AOAH [Branchiostoma lanceolatum]|uniref:AOAH protein n=1 Tax=Branchiostoma lanceolatum TaxID=7740 RepID=A0A8K0F0T6_BRALA|nr:AOAH [Branchiostoma lanceolatum]CAH1270440.1 AOAH [Branchiostoma lanceolatum]